MNGLASMCWLVCAWLHPGDNAGDVCMAAWLHPGDNAGDVCAASMNAWLHPGDNAGDVCTASVNIVVTETLKSGDGRVVSGKGRPQLRDRLRDGPVILTQRLFSGTIVSKMVVAESTRPDIFALYYSFSNLIAKAGSFNCQLDRRTEGNTQHLTPNQLRPAFATDH